MEKMTTSIKKWSYSISVCQYCLFIPMTQINFKADFKILSGKSEKTKNSTWDRRKNTKKKKRNSVSWYEFKPQTCPVLNCELWVRDVTSLDLHPPSQSWDSSCCTDSCGAEQEQWSSRQSRYLIRVGACEE